METRQGRTRVLCCVVVQLCSCLGLPILSILVVCSCFFSFAPRDLVGLNQMLMTVLLTRSAVDAVQVQNHKRDSRHIWCYHTGVVDTESKSKFALKGTNDGDRHLHAFVVPVFLRSGKSKPHSNRFIPALVACFNPRGPFPKVLLG